MPCTSVVLVISFTAISAEWNVLKDSISILSLSTVLPAPTFSPSPGPGLSDIFSFVVLWSHLLLCTKELKKSNVVGGWKLEKDQNLVSLSFFKSGKLWAFFIFPPLINISPMINPCVYMKVMIKWSHISLWHTWHVPFQPTAMPNYYYQYNLKK